VRRSIVLLLLLLAGLWAGPVGRPSAAGASEADEAARFVELLDEVRADAGLPPLVVHAELADLSRGWTEAMRDAGRISHADPISAGLTAPWHKLGENVGTGPDVDDVMRAFVESPGHYANIVDPDFTHVGVAVVRDGARLYTTHRFMSLQPPPQPPA
jgi:uncharacterized protein YkwD